MVINPQAPVFNSIVFYILIIVSLAMIKPNFIYDHSRKQFREFGYGEPKTLCALPVLGVGSAILMYLVFSSIERLNRLTVQSQK